MGLRKHLVRPIFSLEGQFAGMEAEQCSMIQAHFFSQSHKVDNILAILSSAQVCRVWDWVCSRSLSCFPLMDIDHRSYAKSSILAITATSWFEVERHDHCASRVIFFPQRHEVEHFWLRRSFMQDGSGVIEPYPRTMVRGSCFCVVRGRRHPDHAASETDSTFSQGTEWVRNCSNTYPDYI